MKRIFQALSACALLVFGALLAPARGTDPLPVPVGIVIMHGKGGSPERHVRELASALEQRGYLVANLEMPWSGRRNYDVAVDAAEREVQTALDALRDRGAKKLFVAGHSQGGLFALHFAGAHRVDGVMAIAPGGNVAGPTFREKIGAALASAHQLIDEGKGNETARLADYEGGRGAYPIVVKPAVYVGWFDPDGAMNEMAAVRRIDPAVPVLYIAPTDDYPALRKTRNMVFGALPANPLTRMAEPAASHLDAPSASVEEIVKWTTEAAGARSQ